MWSLLDNSYQLTHVWDAWGAETEPLPPHVHTSPGTNTPRMESGVWGGKAFVYNWEDGHVTTTLPSLHLFCGWWYQPKKLVFACPQLALTFVSVQMLIFPFVGNDLRWFSYHHNPSEQSGRRKFASLFHEYWLAPQDGVLHKKKKDFTPGASWRPEKRSSGVLPGKGPEEGPGRRVHPSPHQEALGPQVGPSFPPGLFHNPRAPFKVWLKNFHNTEGQIYMSNIVSLTFEVSKNLVVCAVCSPSSMES